METKQPNAAAVCPRRRGNLVVAGLVLGMVLTVTVVPFTWVKAVGIAATFGSPGPRTTALFLTASIVAGWAGWSNRGAPLLTPLAGRMVLLSLPAVWCGAIAVSVFRLWQIWVPAWLAIPLIVLASCHVLWFLWMWLLPISRWARLGILLMLLAGSLPFLTLFTFTGFAGEGHPVVTWRWRAAPTTGRASSAGVPADDAIPGPDTSARDYPQFMGPQRTGVLEDIRLPVQTPREIWRREIGAGWGAFAVAGNVAYTQEQRDELECVVAYRVSDGQPLWRHEDILRFDSSVGGSGPRATPTLHQGRLYAVGATGRLNCLNAASGERIWSVDINSSDDVVVHGTTASPLVIPPWVIVCPATDSGPGVVAYEMATGELRWQNRDHLASYASPLYARIEGADQVLAPQRDALRAFDLETGLTLWQIPWSNDTQTIASQPIVHAGQPNRVFVSAGYGTGCGMFDVVHQSDGWSIREVWTSRHLKTKFCSAVLVGDAIFGLDNGILCAVDVATGKLNWKQGRYGHGQLLCAGDTLIVVAERGYLAFVAADPQQYRELARIDAMNSKTWNHPTLAWPYLLVRNDREAVCFRFQ